MSHETPTRSRVALVSPPVIWIALAGLAGPCLLLGAGCSEAPRARGAVGGDLAGRSLVDGALPGRDAGVVAPPVGDAGALPELGAPPAPDSAVGPGPAPSPDVGGYPPLQQNRRALTLPASPGADDDGDGYTNLEEWLHELAVDVGG